MKKDVWLRLTTRKNNPDIEELLTKEVNRYYNGFEKALLKQKNNNIKITIEAQVGEERKRLKDRLNEYNKCMIDMKQTTYSFKYQLEDQHNFRSAELEKQYKSRISTLEKAMVKKDREVGKLSSAVFQDKNDLKKSLSSAKKTIKLLDDIIFAKDQTIIAYNEGIRAINPSCIDDTIEPTSFYEKDARDLWRRWYDDAKDDPNIRKKYAFRSCVHSSIIPV
ncbi:hypothetical protein C1646_764615 [Rhizophagus diaphanus]|nr:hypothetical protein C1646_764615 [Rhizophagus diaphanus] [Rhizophagus sp. MUCL 43196]